jgi:prepilin-type N-terminal cleavage/methylation domain-containing protein
MKKTFPCMQNMHGFTLVEMAVVLVILGFVISALLLPLEAQRQQLFQSEIQNTLDSAEKALIGYAQSQGRLPCPATSTSNGIADPSIGGTCTVSDGFLPAATLGIRPTDEDGYALDPWNNRIRYAVTQTDVDANAAPDFTTSDGMAAAGMTILQPDLRVCASATGITATTCSGGTESNYLINNAVAVIYSTGENVADGSGGNDEDANLDGGPVFVSHDPSATGAANGEFDHLVTWISPFVLYNAMIAAGQLH